MRLNCPRARCARSPARRPHRRRFLPGAFEAIPTDEGPQDRVVRGRQRRPCRRPRSSPSWVPPSGSRPSRRCSILRRPPSVQDQGEVGSRTEHAGAVDGAGGRLHVQDDALLTGRVASPSDAGAARWPGRWAADRRRRARAWTRRVGGVGTSPQGLYPHQSVGRHAQPGRVAAQPVWASPISC